jgi:4-diphosphocytidyl-2-C-methyl-D-erythritol kinase
MRLKSYARITLALDIIRKLDNGYHELEAIKTRINLFDEISIEVAKTTSVACNKVKDTIVLKAITALKEKYKIDKNVKIKIKKNIPIAGGLAGGSSDAGYVISALNELWNLKIPREELVLFARAIGRDIPFFFFDGLVFDTEVGAEISTIGDSPKLFVVLVNDGTVVSTKEAYSWIDYSKIGLVKASDSIRQNTKNIILHNDFEQFVFCRHKNLQRIKEELKRLGLLACISGSGSTVFGISADKKIAQSAFDSLKNTYKMVELTETIS